jgi:hypothetical protein
MSDEGRARRKEPWDMTGPELIEALATEVFSGSTMKTAQAREVQALITAWQDAAASDHAHAQRQAERAEQAEARVAKLEGALRRYGRHEDKCYQGNSGMLSRTAKGEVCPCTCGLWAALSAPGQPEGGE